METNTNTPETFDFLQHASGTSFPTDTVNIYTDVDAAYHIEKLEQQANSETDTDKVSALEEQIAVLRKRFEASRYVVHMRGLSGKVEEEINADADKLFGEDVPEKANPQKDEWYNRALIGRHIVKVVDAEGRVDESKWDSDKIKALFATITPEGVARLASKTRELTFRSDIFENVEVNPSF